MHQLTINLPQKQYPIYIENNIFAQIGQRLAATHPGRKIAIVTDSNVDVLYGGQLLTDLEGNGFTVRKFVVPAGEPSKSLSMLDTLYQHFLDFTLSRSDVIVALGGGVIGDLVGFAASTYLRGTGFIQIPTTLLAQIDSSIGGKVAVNLPRGKNLVGAFYHPDAVFIDPQLLNTLPLPVLRDGIAEVIKYGAISNTGLFSRLENLKDEHELLASATDIIAACCQIKQYYVENDEKDHGERMILNFGHTIGHAIESFFNYEVYSHGEAVAIGMALITRSSEQLGISAPGTYARIKQLVTKYSLPSGTVSYDAEALRDAMLLDKKNSGSGLNLILLKEVGQPFIKKIPIAELDSYL